MTLAVNIGDTTVTPDHVADYVNAFRVGQALTPSNSPRPSLDQFTNAVTGRLALPDGSERDQAARRAELLGAIGAGLSDLPYAQRAPILAHLAPALAGEGIPSNVVMEFDPTDDALVSSVAQAKTASQLLSR